MVRNSSSCDNVCQLASFACQQELSGLVLAQVKPAYLVLDAFHHGQVEGQLSVTKIMADSEYLRECQDLFELYVSDYIMLMRCKVMHLSLLLTAICTSNGKVQTNMKCDMGMTSLSLLCRHSTE